MSQVMEFMLMAGEAVGNFAIDNQIPFLFSSQVFLFLLLSCV